MTKTLREPFPELSPLEVGANRRAWLAALRSGNYPQTRRALRRNNSFCCLGVAEDVVDCTWLPFTSAIDSATHTASHPGPAGPSEHVALTTLTRVGASRLGLPVVPWVAYRGSGPVLVGWHVATLVKLNDDYRLTFAEIADVIEFQGEFWNGSWEQATALAKIAARRDELAR